MERKFVKRLHASICWLFTIISFLYFSSGTKAEPIKTLRVGLIESLISGIDMKDSKVAVEILAEKISKTGGFPYDTELVFYENDRQALEEVEMGKIDVVGVSAIAYLEMYDRMSIKPALVAESIGDPLVTYVLLVHKDRFSGDLGALEKKTLLLLKGEKGITAKFWLETLLLERSLPVNGSFFGEIKMVDKVSRALLPVFFEQADACIIPYQEFETMKELNPQIGQKLRILQRSPELLVSVLFLGKRLDETTRNVVIDTQINLNQSIEGRQILTIMQCKRIVPYRNEYLSSIKRLYERNSYLKGK